MTDNSSSCELNLHWKLLKCKLRSSDVSSMLFALYLLEWKFFLSNNLEGINMFMHIWSWKIESLNFLFPFVTLFRITRISGKISYIS